MDEIIPSLYLGDFRSAMDEAALKGNGITHVLSVMKQRVVLDPTLAVKQIRLDDDVQALVLTLFEDANRWIEQAIRGGGKVLVHCQAGVSRSPTFCLAFLMWSPSHSHTLSSALTLLQSVRPSVEPNSGLMEQLEMYERVGCVVDMRDQDIRRWLMGRTADILNGDNPSNLLLSYYPSPHSSPGIYDHSSDLAPLTPIFQTDGAPDLAMSKVDASDSSGSSSRSNVGRGNVGTKVTIGGHRALDGVKGNQKPGASDGGLGVVLSKPTYSGRKLRCKMCRRELAAREHIITHEPGIGQMAFAPKKRDPNRYRQERLEREVRRSEEEASVTSASRADITKDEEGEQTQAKEGAKQTATDGTTDKAATSSGAHQSSSIPRTAAANETVPKSPPPAHPQFQTAAALTSQLPPHLAALRLGRAGPGQAQPMQTQTQRHSGPASSRPGSNKTPSTAVGSTSNSPACGISPSPRPSEPMQQQPPRSASPPLLISPLCQSYFLEPMSWMSEKLETGELAGRLVCPNKRCGAKLGTWDWAGSQCSCGGWVVPAFMLPKSKVDEVMN